MGRTLVMGDIHGNLKALRECLKKSSFDAQEDVLIQLGDVSDRGPDTAEVVELLLSIPRLIAIKGNHDLWTSEWIAEDRRNPVWLSNGGLETIKSYKDSGIDKSKHKNFFESQILYHVDDRNRIYVHGGFKDPRGPAFDLMKDHCLWDRNLWEEALLSENADFIDLPLVSGFKEIYIGHTPTIKLGAQDPMRALNVWNLDTGAGHPNGRLTIIDVETKEYWQSEITEKIYLK